MKRIAVFVDAGYLYAQGSACLQGNKAKRESIKLDHVKFLAILKALASKVQPDAPLLRVYWYDGTSRGPTLDHRTLADLDDLKLRLGFINSVGQQKGVDSLLVTDLVELSRNGAICDAVLLGGDEDLRIGVQIAQSFGVRVHLIGIEPSRGSQSLQLRQESDTKHEITAIQVSDFLGISVPPLVIQQFASNPKQLAESALSVASNPAAVATPSSLESMLDQGIDSVLVTISTSDIAELKKGLVNSPVIPAIYDRRVLASCRTSVGRDLSMSEKKVMRLRLLAKIQSVPS